MTITLSSLFHISGEVLTGRYGGRQLDKNSLAVVNHVYHTLAR